MAENETDGKRLSDLERRWRDEPGSRVFLQLAEEYRRTGQTEEALKVLEEGLERNPQHVAAQVARARCLLELARTGEAVQVLDRVLEQDATHLVARKLLVEAHIQRGDALAARRQLDLYTTLAGADPEVEEVRDRIQGLLLADAETLTAAEPSTAPEETAPPPGREPAAAPEAPAAGRAPAVSFLESPAVESPDSGSPAPSPPPPAGAVELPRSGEPFPGLEQEVVRPGDGSAAGDVFLSAPVEPLRTPAAGSPGGEPAESLEPPRQEEPRREVTLHRAGPTGEAEPSGEAEELAVDEDDTLPLGPVAAVGGRAPRGEEGGAGLEAPADARERAASGVHPPEAGSAAAEREPPATVTLGQLYLRQGHLDEAERIFRRVLERDPDNPAAREGVARATEATGAEITAAPPAVSGAPVANLTEMKVQLLERYLTLLRRGAERDVP